MKQTISYKNFFINYIIFVLISAVVFLLLVYTVKVSQKYWDKNLKVTVQNFLDENEEDTWLVESACRINNPLITSAACYDTKNKKNGEYYKAVIIRIQTFYGPTLGIFVGDKNNNFDFKGYALLHGRIEKKLNTHSASRRVEYWKMRLPDIIK